jgi:hypothetical protein
MAVVPVTSMLSWRPWSPRRQRSWPLELIVPALLCAINCYVCRKLFFVGFSKHMESIESSYMSISHYATRHWGDLSWFPLWYTGMPFAQVYQPGLHLTVAACSTLVGVPVQHVYHFITALAYVLGPVVLYLFCRITTRSRQFAFVTAIVYSLISTVNFFSPALANDTGGRFHPRRLFVLIKYGEGPHITALLLLPLAILLLHRAITERRPMAFPFACCGLAAVVVTNWPGTVALAIAVLSYCLSRIGQRPSISWTRFIGACMGAYLIVCPWIPPSVILFVLRNARESDPTNFGTMHYVGLASVFLGLGLLTLAFVRAGASPWFRFFAYFTWLTGATSLGFMWFNIRLIPQPWRFQLEFELGMAGVIAYLGTRLYASMSRRTARWCVAAVFTILCILQIRTFQRFARSEIGSVDVTKTLEYRMAKAFEQYAGGSRVFAPGNVSLWLNMFTEVPQVVGCCDQAVPTLEHRIAPFVIYSGMGTGDRDAYISLLWLKAYGAQAVGVTGKNSTEPFKPFVNPNKFAALLPEVWRNGDDVIYRIPSNFPTLAHVIQPSEVISRAPVNGLDIDPIVPYVRALDDGGRAAAQMTWIDPHQLRIRATLSRGELISLQETYDWGWRATVGGQVRKVTADALGMIVVDPQCTGACEIDLVYDRAAERIGTRISAGAGALFLLVCFANSLRPAVVRQSTIDGK